MSCFFFILCFIFLFVCVFVLIFESRQGFSVALDPVFGTSLRLASKSQRSTCLFQIRIPSFWMLSSCWVQKPPHKQFPETTWWESNDLFWWQGLDMHICCSLVGAGKNYLLAEVGKLLNSVIFRFVRKTKQNETKIPFFVLFHILTWFFFLRQDLSFYLCFRQNITLHGPALLSEYCCCK